MDALALRGFQNRGSVQHLAWLSAGEMADEDPNSQGDITVRVPGEHRMDILTAGDGLMIQGDDCDSWKEPTPEEREHVSHFLKQEKVTGEKRKSLRVGFGRVGFNSHGVFVLSNHVKRYFGIKKSHANVLLLNAVPEAVPKLEAQSGAENNGLLGALARSMATVGDEVRTTFLKATFARADRNNNGKLSRPELGSMMRKLLNTMSADDIEKMMEKADTDYSHSIGYDEFVTWLNSEHHDRVMKILNTEADLVKATFRLWDKNGDGLVKNKDLIRILEKSCDTMSPKQLKALVDTIDASDDGEVDYDEFVDFVFT
eukprot:s98_g34.t1